MIHEKLTMIPVRENSEVLIISSHIYIYYYMFIVLLNSLVYKNACRCFFSNKKWGKCKMHAVLVQLRRSGDQ